MVNGPIVVTPIRASRWATSPPRQHSMFPTANQAQQLVQRITTQLGTGQLGGADRDLDALSRIAPNSLDTHRLRGQVRTAQGRFAEAGRSFDIARAASPKDVNVLMGISQLRYREGRFDECIGVLEEVLVIKPGFAAALGMMAGARCRQGQPKLALKILEKLPKSPPAAITAAWAYHDLDEPERVLAVLSPVLAGPDPGPLNRAQAYQIRGLALEKLGRYDAAMASYIEAKQAVPVSFDFQRYTDWLDGVKSVYSAAAWPTLARSTNQNDRPVIIAAMPRSGTTLLEAIIAAHPQAADAGEVDVTRRMVEETMKPSLAESWPAIVPATFTTELLDRWAARYTDATTIFGPESPRIVDKHLYNWIYLGLFGQMFPKARAIHIKRNPLDIGISCFERIAATAVPWSANLHQLGTVIRRYQELMEHWKALNVLPILTVEYEQLVRNPEAETRRIIEFLGLPWDDACLAHHDKSRQKAKARTSIPAPTLGSAQAAKPVYDSSVGRGSRFGAAIEPLRKAIAGER